MGDSGIRDWVQSGRLHRLYRGVYAYGHDRLRVEGRWLAAVYACGPGAVLSHRDAAQLWELRQSNAALIDVTVPARAGRRKRAGIRIHGSGRLAPEEVTVQSGIPVTTVARTLLDLADVLDKQAPRRAVTEAEYTNRFDLTSLNAVVQDTRAANAEADDPGVWIEGYEVDFLARRCAAIGDETGTSGAPA